MHGKTLEKFFILCGRSVAIEHSLSHNSARIPADVAFRAEKCEYRTLHPQMPGVSVSMPKTSLYSGGEFCVSKYVAALIKAGKDRFTEPPRRNEIGVIVDNVVLRPSPALIWGHFFIPAGVLNGTQPQ